MNSISASESDSDPPIGSDRKEVLTYLVVTVDELLLHVYELFCFFFFCILKTLTFSDYFYCKIRENSNF